MAISATVPTGCTGPNTGPCQMERVLKIVLRSVDSGGICSGRASGVSPEMYVDGTESIPRCSRAPRKLSSPPEWSLFTCTNTMFLLMIGMGREGTKQGGWERAGRDWVKRPCPNTATSKVLIFEDSLLDVACQGLCGLSFPTSLAGEWASLH